MPIKIKNSSQVAREILAQVKGLDVVKCELCEEVEKIHLHHIDKNHNNCKIANLILLCQKCHHKAHEEDGFFGKNKKVNISEDKENLNKFIKKEVNKIIKQRKKDFEVLKERLEQEKRLKQHKKSR